MRPTPADLPARMRVLAAVIAVAGALACERPTDPGRVRSLQFDVPTQALRPGDYMRIGTRALDASGELVPDAVVQWHSLTPATLDISRDGLMLGLSPGTGIARASVGQVHALVQIQLRNPPIASIRIDLDTVMLELPGSPHQVNARAYDSVGIGIIAPTLTWSASAARFATVNATGLVSGLTVGESMITASGDGFSDSVLVRVQAAASPTAPVISTVAPGSIAPGEQLVLTGTGFAATPAGNTVHVDGTAVPVVSASTSQLTLTMPAATAFTCQPSRPVTLQVATTGGIGVAQVVLDLGAPITLGVGESTVLSSAALRCTILSPATGRYLVTVPNVARTFGAGTNGIGVTVRGEGRSSGGALMSDAGLVAARNAVAIREDRERASAAARSFDGREWFRGRRARAIGREHDRLQRAAAAAVARAEAVAPRYAPPRAALTAPTVGTIVPLNVPSTDPAAFCTGSVGIGARIVHVSEHFAMLEDTATLSMGDPTLAGQVDADYVALADELEARGWPITTAFGNPLAADDRLDDNGRVLIVFTPRINARSGGNILAAVVPCDFFTPVQAPSSNVGEFIYAQVPTSLSDVMEPGTRAFWRYEMRSTLVHELKHVTSYAERIPHRDPIEEVWLEEATARHAEELYARAAYGSVRFGNSGFSASLACELRANDPAFPQCADAPRAVRQHLEALWEFLAAPTARSPLGGTANDFSFYGSAWALTRWVADLDAPNEPEFFAGLTANRLSGIANLEARVGRPWEQMVPEWSLAMLVDDYPGFTPQSERLVFRSFDLRSLYLGLCEVAGSCIVPSSAPWTRPWPVQPLTVQGGPFAAEYASIQPGGFAVLELVIPAGIAAQSIELRGYRGAPLPSTARLAIVRVQ